MSIPAAIQIPAILSTATVSPCFAIRVRREALPLRFVEKEEKTSFYTRIFVSHAHILMCDSNEPPQRLILDRSSSVETYRMVDYTLIPRMVMDVDCDGSKSGDFGREATEERIVLPIERMLAIRAEEKRGLE